MMINNIPVRKAGMVSAVAVAPLMKRSKREPGLNAEPRPMNKASSTVSVPPYPTRKIVVGSRSNIKLIADRLYTMDWLATELPEKRLPR